MGIPWYFYNIYTKYNSENDLTINEEDISKLDISDLFLDYNSMIHPCSQKAIELYELEINDKKRCLNLDDLEEEIIESCLNYTRYIISMIKPINVYIMIDGVAPRAKINQQRERRYKSHFFKGLPLIKESNDTNEYKDKIKVTWNSNKITPGTLFMEKLSNSLNKFKIELLNNKNTDFYSPKDIIISDSNEAGEGEHKMMKIISNKEHYNIGEKICIYGLDADLIMLSLMNKFSDNIILIRDNTFNKKLLESKRNYMYLNIYKLKKYICKDLRYENKSLTMERIDDNDLLLDYIFLCFLLGNDFLEHIPSLMIKENGINILLKYYNLVMNTKKYKKLVNIRKDEKMKDNINLDMLKDIFYHLSKSEEYFFKNVYSIYKNSKSNKVYKDIYDLEKINNENKVILPTNLVDDRCTFIQNRYFYKDDILKLNEIGYKQRYYNFYGIEIDDNKFKVCKNYLTGLYWILGYYNGHCHENWDWFYENEAIPFASDIFHYLLNYKHNFDVNIKSCMPNTKLEQLFMVLPRESLLEIIGELDIKLLEKTSRIFNTYSEELERYYPKIVNFELINKEYLWQSKIFLKPFKNKIINMFI
jgi:5'-3' exonuclease